VRTRLILLGALLALGMAGCERGAQPPPTAANPLADSADQVMFGVSTLITDRGLLRAQLQADTAYFFDGSTRIEVRNQKTTFYTNTGQQNAVLTSKEGTYSPTRSMMEARKNAVVVTVDGRRLETQQLRYNQAINQISSDSAFVLTEPTRQLRGIGFDSDPDLNNLHVKRVLTGTGTFTIPGQTR
jgi:LPS export ABC transporter protein LptC